MSRLQIQLPSQLTEQIQGRSRGPVQIQDLIQVGMQSSGKGARRCRFTGADLAGQQTGTMMIYEELKTGVDLIPGFGSEQLPGVRMIAKRSFFETEEGIYHGDYSRLLLFTSRSTRLIPVGAGGAGRAGL